MANCSKNIAKNIEAKVKDLGITKSELARRANVSPMYLSQVLNGANQNPAISQLENIAEALNTTLIELLGSQAQLQRLANHSQWDCLHVVRDLFQEIEKGDLGKAVRTLIDQKK
jgi:transcriptional regulator with XRE-family HTH domain